MRIFDRSNKRLPQPKVFKPSCRNLLVTTSTWPEASSVRGKLVLGSLISRFYDQSKQFDLGRGALSFLENLEL